MTIDDIRDELITEIQLLFSDITSDSREAAIKVMEDTELFLEEFLGSPNFVELSRNHAAQVANRLARHGIASSERAQETARNIALTTLRILKVVLSA